MSRMVMIHGVCPGIGQSTLTRRLAEAIPEVDVLWEDERSRPAIFTRAEFVAVADRFHRHNADPARDVGHPPAQLLEDAYRALVGSVLSQGRPALLGWSFLDLAEDLDWARANEAALFRHSASVRRLMRPTDPVLIYLMGDIPQAVERALAQRGPDWFNRGRPVRDQDWSGLYQRRLEEYEEAAGRISRALKVGGWSDAVEIDGLKLSPDEVFRVAASELRCRGLEVRV